MPDSQYIYQTRRKTPAFRHGDIRRSLRTRNTFEVSLWSIPNGWYMTSYDIQPFCSVEYEAPSTSELSALLGIPG